MIRRRGMLGCAAATAAVACLRPATAQAAARVAWVSPSTQAESALFLREQDDAGGRKKLRADRIIE